MCWPSCVRIPRPSARAGLSLWLILLLPTARTWLESNMVLHMLVQLPLLGLAGWLVGSALPAKMRRSAAPWNRQGISGLLLASMLMALWMLPVALDAAIDQAAVTAAKFVSLPLLVGLPCALSWPQAGFIVRGVFLVELIATLFRTGWLYLASPVRLCTSYLLETQQIAGKSLLAAGVLILFLVALQLLWGSTTRFAGLGTRAGPEHRQS